MTHVVMTTSSVYSAMCDGISCTNTVYIFVETANVPDLSEFSKLYCFNLLFILCTGLELAHETQMHR
jgi:hypothetical protein